MKVIAKHLAAALFGTILAAAPALAQTVTVDYDHTVNFPKFKSYTLQKVHASDPGVEGRLTIAVDRDLQARFLHPQDKDADLIIGVVEVSTEKQEYTDFYGALGELSWQRGWGSGGFLDSTATVEDIAPGTLVFDMWDGKTKKLIWRGTITESSTGTGDKQDQKIDKAIGQVLGKFPPKFQKS